MDLANKKCVPCEGGIKPIGKSGIAYYKRGISKEWKVIKKAGVQRIARLFKFRNFLESMAFVNSVADIAEEEAHHPDIFLFGYNKVEITLYTHAIKGLHENDFVLAAKIEKIPL